MNILKVGVVGSGIMGSGIVQVFSRFGYDTMMVDISEVALEKGLANINRGLERLVSKSVIGSDEKNSIYNRISTSTTLKDLSDCQLVVEAANENEELKLKIFKDLSEICNIDAILSSNTSSISLTRIAASVTNPERVIGMHFMNPAPVMSLVEIIRASQTSENVFEQVNSFVKSLEKSPISVKDSPSFVVNRILIPMINEAIFVYYEGLASAEDIDCSMKLGASFPMGPLALADFIGLDTCLEIMNVLYNGFNDTKYRPCILLKNMVDAGYLGRKSGIGFYTYNT